MKTAYVFTRRTAKSLVVEASPMRPQVVLKNGRPVKTTWTRLNYRDHPLIDHIAKVVLEYTDRRTGKPDFDAALRFLDARMGPGESVELVETKMGPTLKVEGVF
jgi:hypothetical protein